VHNKNYADAGNLMRHAHSLHYTIPLHWAVDPPCMSQCCNLWTYCYTVFSSYSFIYT